MKNVKKENRAKLDELLKKVKYSLYQANIRHASHDDEKLIESCRRIRSMCCKMLKRLHRQKAG